ncbi:MAG TPA: thioesterase family protein [Anaerolineae bacterium]
MAEPRPVTVAIQIRWSDLDALGHVNNAVYLSYLEIARIAYMRAVLPPGAEINPATLLARDFEFILAEVQIHYRSPALLTDDLETSIVVTRVGRKSFVFGYQIIDRKSGRLIAEACSTQVWYDYEVGESRPVPEQAVQRMETLQGAPIPRG